MGITEDQEKPFEGLLDIEATNSPEEQARGEVRLRITLKREQRTLGERLIVDWLREIKRGQRGTSAR